MTWMADVLIARWGKASTSLTVKKAWSGSVSLVITLTSGDTRRTWHLTCWVSDVFFSVVVAPMPAPEVTPAVAPVVDFYARGRMIMQKKLLVCCREAVLKSHGLSGKFHGARFFSQAVRFWRDACAQMHIYAPSDRCDLWCGHWCDLPIAGCGWLPIR